MEEMQYTLKKDCYGVQGEGHVTDRKLKAPEGYFSAALLTKLM